eukprot:936521-Alexandrium_andersonii.AAC.1
MESSGARARAPARAGQSTQRLRSLGLKRMSLGVSRGSGIGPRPQICPSRAAAPSGRAWSL